MHSWGPYPKSSYKSICAKCGAVCDYVDPKPDDLSYFNNSLNNWRITRFGGREEVFTCDELSLHSVLDA